jgi:Tol biopolymer transport system component
MEVAIPSGRVRTMLASGGISFFPAWAPSGTHYLYATNRSGKWTVEDAPAGGGFERRVAEGDSVDIFTEPRWAPDGGRFTFDWNGFRKPPKVVLASAAGGTTTPLDPSAQGMTAGAVWSPDGQWVVYQRSVPDTGEYQVAKIRPGAHGGPEILATYKTAELGQFRTPLDWSPKGDQILAVSNDGLYMMSPDYKTERKLASGNFNVPLGFSKDGKQVLGLFPNTAEEGSAWLLMSYDVATGAAKQLAGVDLPVTTSGVRGFSLHPDGSRFAISIAKWPFDIWMLEGFE